MSQSVASTSKPNLQNRTAGSRRIVSRAAHVSRCAKSIRLPSVTGLKGLSSRTVVLRAAAEDQVEVVPLGAAAAAAAAQPDPWVPVIRPEELPKGVRKEVYVNGRNLLLFWYRNQIYCIESRSPAEGAYSSGFIASKFTQDFGIECPSTGTVFSLKDGSILEWYPNNPIMKALISADTCRKLEMFPVKLTQQAILVDTSKAQFNTFTDKGGADTSLEGNNVFAVQPKLYYEGADEVPDLLPGEMPKQRLNPFILATGTVAVGLTGAIGTAVLIFYEEIPALIAFWVVLGGVSIASALTYFKSLDEGKA